MSEDLLAECRRKPAARPVLLYSGGLDSTVLLYERKPAACLFFSYGQKHMVELFRAQDHCKSLGVPLVELRLPRLEGSTLTHGRTGNCVVPARNLVFLAVAANYAIAHDHDEVLIGCNRTDRDLFPDCRKGFLEYVRHAVIASGHDLMLSAPYLDLTKRDLAQKARALGIARDSVWTCYNGGEEPCGECLACKAEEEAWS